MKTLVFDSDFSLASIGGEKELVDVFGIKPTKITKGVGETRQKLGKLIVAEKMKNVHELFDDTEEIVLGLSERAKEVKLECLVFDTITSTGLQERTEIRKKYAPKKNGVPVKPYPPMELRWWGEYGDSMVDFVYNASQLPITIIMSGHIDRDKDANGDVIEFPALKGGAKNEVQKWFDVILYAYTARTGEDKKKTEFYWQTKPSPGRFAKDRLGVLDPIMVQDFSILINNYRKCGVKQPKILLLGESGSGKTYSLKTLKGV